MTPTETLRQRLHVPAVWLFDEETLWRHQVLRILDIGQRQTLNRLLHVAQHHACPHEVPWIQKRNIRDAFLVSPAVRALVTNLHLGERFGIGEDRRSAFTVAATAIAGHREDLLSVPYLHADRHPFGCNAAWRIRFSDDHDVC